MEFEGFELERGDRVVLVGVGSEIRGGDAAGSRVVERLEEDLNVENVLFIRAGTVPENFTSEVKGFEPDKVLIVDTVDFGGSPGEVSPIDPTNILRGSESTHRLPLSEFISYLGEETGAEFLFIGIQPGGTDLFSEMSEPVEEAVDELVLEISERLESIR